MKKKALFTAVVGAAVAMFAKRSKAQKAQRDLWNEAGQSSDR